MIVFFLPDAVHHCPFFRRLGSALEAVSTEPAPPAAPVSPDAGAVGEADMERNEAEVAAGLQEGSGSSSTPWSPPPSDPPRKLTWTVKESNAVYVAAVRVAESIFKMHRKTDTTGMLDTSMKVLEHAREIARQKQLDHRQMIAALTHVSQVIEQTIVELWGDYAEGWWKAEAAQAGRLLWLATSVEAPLLRTRGPVGAREAAANFMEHVERELAGLGPVNIVGNHVVVSINPEGPEWAVPLEDMPNPTTLLKYVHQMTEKVWCSRELVHHFVSAVCNHRGWEIYNFEPGLSQERA